MRALRRFCQRRLQSVFLPSALSGGNLARGVQRHGHLRFRRLAGLRSYFFRHKGGLLQGRARHKYARTPAQPYFILWQGKRSSNSQKRGVLHRMPPQRASCSEDERRHRARESCARALLVNRAAARIVLRTGSAPARHILQPCGVLAVALESRNGVFRPPLIRATPPMAR